PPRLQRVESQSRRDRHPPELGGLQNGKVVAPFEQTGLGIGHRPAVPDRAHQINARVQAEAHFGLTSQAVEVALAECELFARKVEDIAAGSGNSVSTADPEQE